MNEVGGNKVLLRMTAQVLGLSRMPRPPKALTGFVRHHRQELVAGETERDVRPQAREAIEAWQMLVAAAPNLLSASVPKPFLSPTIAARRPMLRV